MRPLSMVRPGERVEIAEIRAGRGLSARLADMGFYPGVAIEVVSNFGRGPLIIAKSGIRLGLGFGIAHQIWVRTIQDKAGL
ncbi:MAG: hypothetical protein B1H40_03490 [Candidatus Latescibacteria bacterium 4484_181]|nr:MAG: hypothetical protein B1H40_03490 [Candidatus Latescibacteria bacterium 4484_181]RKY66210.1 MAG: hypothetical protein DRQ02_09180 [Candidatus Latescibacterota bacterium]RKY71000.1 MAG: hypothetical protein DRQ24_08270 [Candidatus Latescibacterota bacterium]